EVVSAPAILETAEQGNGRREALIIRDPDDCIDMRDFPITNPGMPYEPCPGQDELYIEFTSERFDSHDLENQMTGNFVVRDRLVDDPDVEGALLNKPYLFDNNGVPKPVPRPRTGDDLVDGYGYGTDDDLPGLVVMADVGGLRVFDPNFDIGDRVIRNASGFLNTVSVELLDKKGRTAIHASMHVLAGVFEPIALFDLDVDNPKVDFLRRLESGEVESFRFDPPPATEEELLEYLVNTYSPVEFDLRAVVVKGIAPEFIEDVNHDGNYTARDVELMGYELLSNQATIHVREAFDLSITDTVLGHTCPSQSLIYRDLDGNGEDGSVDCSGTGGARRLRRIPR
ncbi:MAG: hypothetical protein R3344_08575, partial [Acidobacteriota bacterium]|nr:hypothetical protein [Acidobacteriota bacterium]